MTNRKNPATISFLFGLAGTILVVDPAVPIIIRTLLAVPLVITVAFYFSSIWLRYAGRKNPFPTWEPILNGTTDGIASVILILTILNFYFNLHLLVPSFG